MAYNNQPKARTGNNFSWGKAIPAIRFCDFNTPLLSLTPLVGYFSHSNSQELKSLLPLINKQFSKFLEIRFTPSFLTSFNDGGSYSSLTSTKSGCTLFLYGLNSFHSVSEDSSSPLTKLSHKSPLLQTFVKGGFSC